MILVPWYTYQRYGNINQLEKAYEPMVRYHAYLQSLAESTGDRYILENTELNRDLGDWVYIDYTDTTLIVSCTYYQLTKTMAEISKVLGKEASHYEELAQNIRAAVNEKFLHGSYYGSDTQTANAFPLYLGIVPESKEKAVAKSLLNTVKRANYHITTGEVGMYPMLVMLSKYGYSEAAYKIVTADSQPGYKYFLELGNTSLPETWSGRASQNHCILGHGAGWMYEYLLGVRLEEGKIVVDPYIPSDLSYVKGSVGTIYGPVNMNWKKKGRNIVMTVEVPVNAEAEIHINGTVKTVGSGVHTYSYGKIVK